MKFLKYISINNHIIDLIDNTLLFYYPIYNLGLLVELKILKIYYLANKFIELSKSFVTTLILFDQKLNKNLQ